MRFAVIIYIPPPSRDSMVAAESASDSASIAHLLCRTLRRVHCDRCISCVFSKIGRSLAKYPVVCWKINSTAEVRTRCDGETQKSMSLRKICFLKFGTDGGSGEFEKMDHRKCLLHASV